MTAGGVGDAPRMVTVRADDLEAALKGWGTAYVFAQRLRAALAAPPTDFYVEDEPIEDVIAAFEKGPHGVTTPPGNRTSAQTFVLAAPVVSEPAQDEEWLAEVEAIEADDDPSEFTVVKFVPIEEPVDALDLDAIEARAAWDEEWEWVARDVPALVAEVRRLTADVAVMCQVRDELVAERDRLLDVIAEHVVSATAALTRVEALCAEAEHKADEADASGDWENAVYIVNTARVRAAIKGDS